MAGHVTCKQTHVPCLRLQHRRFHLLPLLALVILLRHVTCAAERDLYEVLGLSDEASDAEIKRAYRALSLRHHPDKGGDAAKFKELTSAYEILSDGNKRALYDVGGMAAVEKGVGGQDMFGRTVGIKKGPAVSVTVRVPLEDVYRGGDVRVNVRRRVVCRGCRHGPSIEKCAGCTASCPAEIKVVARRMGPMIVNQEVSVPSEERCKEEVRTLHATIERGVEDGEVITFERASEQSPGVIPGDVVVTLATAEHAVFARHGHHLSMKLTISLRQALLGFSRTIRHLDGHEVKITSDKVSRPQEVLVLNGEGLPVKGRFSEFGDLRVTLIIEFPSMITSGERDWLRHNLATARDS